MWHVYRQQCKKERRGDVIKGCYRGFLHDIGLFSCDIELFWCDIGLFLCDIGLFWCEIGLF